MVVGLRYSPRANGRGQQWCKGHLHLQRELPEQHEFDDLGHFACDGLLFMFWCLGTFVHEAIGRRKRLL